MPANQVSSTPPTTAASSDQAIQDGAGRLWTSLGQIPALQTACRRLPAFRCDMEAVRYFFRPSGSRMNRTTLIHKLQKEANDESGLEVENRDRLGAARHGWRNHGPCGFRQDPRFVPAGAGREARPEPADSSDRCR